MNIRNTKELCTFASQRVAAAQNQKQIVLIFSGIMLGLAGIIPVINFLLGLLIDQYSGLRHMSTRTMLASIQTMLPIAVNLLTMCLTLGYVAAMLRVARGQYVSPQTLRLGFDRFWVLLRSQIIRGLILVAILSLSVYLGIMLFMVTPLSQGVIEILTPYLSGLTDPTALVLSDEVYAQFLVAAIPAYILCGLFALLLAGPMLYSYRMVNYLLIDNPAMGALEALRKSKRMMHGNRLALLKLDLYQWKYYLASCLAYVLCYGDMILPELGISLPGHTDVWYFVFLALYLAAQFAVYCFLRNPVETAYGLAYDAVKPEQPQDNAVVLGNIFQM